MNGNRFTDDSRLASVEYEVYGLVQGECFRKYAYQKATENGLHGCVKNTRTGSIAGILQGPKDKVADMKEWLYKTGSPRSVIQVCAFSNEREIINYEYPHFTIEPSDW